MNGSCVSYLNLQWDRIKMSEARLDSGSVLYELLLHVFEEKTWCCTWLLRLQSPTQALEIQGVQIANQNWIELGWYTDELEVTTKVTCRFGTLLWTLNHGPWDVLAGFLPSSRSFNFRILARGSPLTVNCICAEKHLKATCRFALRSEKSSASLLPSQWFMSFAVWSDALWILVISWLS